MINVNESATRIEEIKYVFIPYHETNVNGDDRCYGHPQLRRGVAVYRSGQLYMLDERPAPSRLNLQNVRYDNMGVYILPGDIK